MGCVGGPVGSEEAHRGPCFVIIIILVFIAFLVIILSVSSSSSIMMVVVMPIAVTSAMVVRTSLTFLLDDGIHYSCLSSRFIHGWDVGKLCEAQVGSAFGLLI